VERKQTHWGHSEYGTHGGTDNSPSTTTLRKKVQGQLLGVQDPTERKEGDGPSQSEHLKGGESVSHHEGGKKDRVEEAWSHIWGIPRGSLTSGGKLGRSQIGRRISYNLLKEKRLYVVLSEPGDVVHQKKY